jgi:hypothetical protein
MNSLWLCANFSHRFGRNRGDMDRNASGPRRLFMAHADVRLERPAILS